MLTGGTNVESVAPEISAPPVVVLVILLYHW